MSSSDRAIRSWRGRREHAHSYDLATLRRRCLRMGLQSRVRMFVSGLEEAFEDFHRIWDEMGEAAEDSTPPTLRNAVSDAGGCPRTASVSARRDGWTATVPRSSLSASPGREWPRCGRRPPGSPSTRTTAGGSQCRLRRCSRCHARYCHPIPLPGPIDYQRLT